MGKLMAAMAIILGLLKLLGQAYRTGHESNWIRPSCTDLALNGASSSQPSMANLHVRLPNEHPLIAYQ